MGGYRAANSPQPNGEWQWVTNEPWTFELWTHGQRNYPAEGDFLHYYHEGVESYWYSLAPSDAFFITRFYLLESSVPRLAEAQAQAVNGFVVGVIVMDGGGGYANPPQINFVGTGGTGAAATAVLVNGVITQIVIDSPGRGYPDNTIVRIQSPGPPPMLSVKTSHITVNMDVTTGCLYQLETSSDLNSWSPSGLPFKATGPSMARVFEVGFKPQYYRIIQIF